MGQIDGWSDNSQSNCNGVNMLGGYGRSANFENKKNYHNLPPHSEIRVKANFHFIDFWKGESGFMKIGFG